MVDAIAEAILLPFPTSFALFLVKVMPGDIGEEVRRPATKLLTDEVESGGNGRLLGKLVDLMQEKAKL